MSYLSTGYLEGHKLIAQYIIEYRARGHFLPDDEHRVIEGWLALTPNADELLLILADLIPLFYARAAERRHPPSLTRLDKKVRRILQARQARQGLAGSC